jgi:isoleucyl-tRNA synthetase
VTPQVLEELNVKEMDLLPPEKLEEMDKPGWAVTMEGDYWVAVSTDIPPELAAEGMAREIVHRLQTMRRSAGFDIADYISTYYQGEAHIRQVMEGFSSYIKLETLSHQLIEGEAEEGAYTERLRIDGYEVVLGVKRS